MRTQKNTSIKKNKKLPTDPKTNRDLKLGYQSKQPRISTKISRYSIFTQNRTKTNDFVNRKMRTTTSSACSAACFLKKCNRICACEDVACPFFIGLLKTLKNWGVSTNSCKYHSPIFMAFSEMEVQFDEYLVGR